MKFTIRDHQNKSARLRECLLALGYEQVPLGSPCEVLFIDTDFPVWHYRDIIDRHKALGAAIILYPHGGNPNMWVDHYGAYEHTDAMLVPAEGHRRFYTAMQYAKPVYVVGWGLSACEPIRLSKGRRVLFAPIHPNGNNFLPDPEKDANRQVFQRLLAIPEIDLTVRYLGTLDANGLPVVEGVSYKRGRFDNSTGDIRHADCVIAEGTYGAMGVALGRPTVMFWQRPGTEELQAGPLPHYDAYKDMARYPLDALEGDLATTLQRACNEPRLMAAWRREWIGQPLRPERLARAVADVLGVGVAS